MTQDPDSTDTEANGDTDVSEGDSAESLLTRIEELKDDGDQQEARYLQQVARPDYADRLQAAAQRLLDQSVNFKVGDLVTWKPALRNRYFPAEGAPAVVVGTTPARISAESDPVSPLFNEPLDLQLGVIDADGEFFVYYYDRRRFTHWHPGKSAESNEQ
jgi:hypothetical protein